MRCALSWLAAALFAGGFCWLFPPFHVVVLRNAAQPGQRPTFDAAAFWNQQLLPASEHAAPAAEALSLLARDPDAARKRFGRSPGLGSTCYFFIEGSGKVTAIEKDGVRIVLEGADPSIPVLLSTGLLFGNSVRDATGLLNISDYPNSQDFNDLSTELNRLVETRVLPALRERANVGKAIQFAGCVELSDATPPKVLEIVPVKIDWP